MKVYIGVDIGGTFTDVVGVDADGEVRATKTPSTPPEFERGFLDGIAKLAGLYGVGAEQLLGDAEIVLHGTTVATNAAVQMRGSRLGVLTTKGHADTLPLMRASGRTKGIPLEQMLRASHTSRPEPLVPRARIAEVAERVDAAGEVVVPLDEDGVAAAVRRLLEEGIEALAVCFLWSVTNGEHERRAAAIAREIAPSLYVTTSHEISARPGEYERFVGAAVNAFVGPETSGYMERLGSGLERAGLENPLLIMQASGGVTTVGEAIARPALTIGSGPAGGVAASAVLAGRQGHPNVITTDMGGTSFDVGLVVDGQAARTGSTILNQYEFYLTRADIESIGSGGGSIISSDPGHGSLRVGPESAGASPGPACYGRGGDRATVTDANVVLGYLDPDYFLAGEISLDREAAHRVLAEAGAPLGMDAIEAAAAAKRIVDAQMADLIRRMTVQRGLDPRDFVVHAFGGAAGMHVAGYVRELGTAEAVVPLGPLAATWSAFGCASADIVHVAEHAEVMASPYDPAALERVLQGLASEVEAKLDAEGIPPERRRIERAVEMKYPLQIHKVEVPIPGAAVDEDVVASLPETFHSRYEDLFGEGSALEGAGTQIVLCRVVGRGELRQPLVFGEQGEAAGSGAAPTAAGARRVAWLRPESGFETLETPIFRSDELVPGTTVAGPAVVEGTTTTIGIPPGFEARADASGNLVLKR